MEPDAAARRLALLIEYQGTAYKGSQYQRNAPTVQGSLERALSSLTGEPVRVALAGRTDAGVHARGQVASFVTRSRHSPEVFTRAANALLPGDIAVRATAEVPPGFDPRRDAMRRWYRYTLHLGPQRPALMRDFLWHVGEGLDVEAMAQGAAAFCGRHDFAAFTAPSEAARRRTEREVTMATLRRVNQLAMFDIEANAFLPHMVRRIMGTLVEIGQGKRPASDARRLVHEATAGEARRMAPARGLCLIKVRYESRLFDAETNEDL